MAAWDTTPQHVDAFVAAVRRPRAELMERLLVGLARAAGRRRWRFVLVWAALLAVALPFTGQVGGALSNGGFNVPGSQSMRLIQARNDAGLGAQPFTLLVVSDDPAATRARFATVLADVRRSFPAAPLPCRAGARPGRPG